MPLCLQQTKGNARAIPSVNRQERLKDASRLQQIVQCCLTNYQSLDIMRLPYILGHNDSLHGYNGVQAQDSFCEHTSNRKITTLVPSLRFSFFSFCSHLYFDLSCYHFYFRFYSELSVGCCHQQMIATFTPEGHLIPRQGKKKICKQLMSCHPCLVLRASTN